MVRQNEIVAFWPLIQLVNARQDTGMLATLIVILRLLGLLCCGHCAVALEN